MVPVFTLYKRKKEAEYKMSRNYEINMCEGPLVPRILIYTAPLIVSSMLQLLFNAVDTIVVGRYCGSDALAAVGSTGSLVNLLMNLIVGSLRGLGCSIVPMIVSLLGACAFRILWINTVFVKYHSLKALYVSYPVSWIITFDCHVICYIIVRKGIERKIKNNDF